MGNEVFLHAPASHQPPSDDLISVHECQAMMGMSALEFTKWFHKGKIDGVQHPAYKYRRPSEATRSKAGNGRLYCRSDAERAASEISGNRVKLDEWTIKDLLAFGVNDMLTQAMDDHAILKRGTTRVKITAVEPNGESVPAREYLPHKKTMYKLIEAGRIRAAAFPAVEFEIEEMEK